MTWPVLSTYDARHLARISLPVGGIGTGTIGFGGRGDLRDFQVGNRPAHGFGPRVAFAAIHVVPDAGPGVTRILEGPLPVECYDGPVGSPVPQAGLPRFTQAQFETCYPMGRALLSDPAVPVEVAVTAFNPLVPGDVEASSWPIAVVRYTLTNPGGQALRASVCLSLSNFIGANGVADDTGGNVNEARDAHGAAGIVMSAPGLEPTHEAAGTLALVTPLGAGSKRRVTRLTTWGPAQWERDVLRFWDDFAADGALEPAPGDLAAPPSGAALPADARPVASLCVQLELDPGESQDVEFVLAWNFPARRAWAPGLPEEVPQLPSQADVVVGNYYSVRYPDVWATALAALGALPELEARTIAAVGAIAGTHAPRAVVEGALNNLSTLRSPTVFRTPDGRFFGWEGAGDHAGSCFGSCTHVWGYEFATSYLFPQIAWSMRDTQFACATDRDGLMSFRVCLPIEHAQAWRYAAADGQMACLVHLYADWRLSGDDAALRRLWPAARRALEFCWIPGGWDADCDGVMEGCQHNTMDVEYYGPNPQMTGWYLAALRAMAAMARHLGEAGFADKCLDLARRGGAWMDEHLFTGEYYRHIVRPPAHPGDIAAGLRHPSMGAASATNPDLQLADGCLVDQLVGDHAAVLLGLGHVVDRAHVARSLDTIVRRGTVDPAGQAVNNMRSFVLGDERGLVMATFPEGKRPAQPFPYFGEVMTGFEYTAALGLVQAGRREAAARVVGDIRARYDGAKRNPFDEAECGRHYARALAAWNVLVAWTGLEYDAVAGVLRLAAPGAGRTSFWAVGRAWGTVSAGGDTPGDGPGEVTVRVCEGEVRLRRIDITGPEGTASGTLESLTAGPGWAMTLPLA